VRVSRVSRTFCSVSGSTPHCTLSLPDPLDATVAPMGCSIANRRRLRVFAQCKAEKRKMGPAYLRELEGVVYKYVTTGIPPHPSKSESPRVAKAIVHNDGDPNSSTPIASKELPPIALLISESPFTRQCLLAAHASPLPFLLVHLPPPPALPFPSSSSDSGGGGGGGGAIGAIFGNTALVSPKGLLGGELEIRWERGGGVTSSSSSQSSGLLDGSGRPRLWWQGQPLPSWTPEADTVTDVDGGGVVLNQRTWSHDDIAPHTAKCQKRKKKKENNKTEEHRTYVVDVRLLVIDLTSDCKVTRGEINGVAGG
jgi:hypothetical protein